MKIMEMTRPKMQAAMQQILDTFTGADGGISFTRLCATCQVLDAMAAKGDRDSEEALKCVLQLHRLIEISDRP